MAMPQPRMPPADNAIHQLSGLQPVGSQSFPLGQAMIRKRGKRAKTHPVVLTERDKNILTLTGLCRYVSTQQMAQEFFPSQDRCRRRLRQLFDAGYLNITLSASTQPNLISLTRLGLNFLQEETPELVSRIRMPGPIRLTGITHHLLCVDVRLWLAGQGKTFDTHLLRWSNSQGDLTKELELKRYHLLPDGLAEIQVQGEIKYIAVEADCGTESLGVLANKLGKYKEAFQDSTLSEVWFVVNSGKDRQQSILRLIHKMGLENHTRIMTQAFIQQRPLNPVPSRVGKHWARKSPNMLERKPVKPMSNQVVAQLYPDDDRRAVGPPVRWGQIREEKQ